MSGILTKPLRPVARNWLDELIPGVIVPEGRCGDWAVERFTVSEQDVALENMRLAFRGQGRRHIYPGTYTRLMYRSALVMSDTRAEKLDHLEAVRQARGEVLLNGLGLGMVLQAMLNKEEVSHATVIEKAEEVIRLCGTHHVGQYGKRATIIHADALVWRCPRGKHYDVVWHDIWGNVCGDNYEAMKTLHRRYGRRCDWQGSWCRAETRALA